MRKVETKKETCNKVVTFRVPMSIFDRYERLCYEKRVKLSTKLKEAINKELETSETN
jgi:hypothetical protein